MEESRNRQNLIEVFKMYREFSDVSLNELFISDTNTKSIRGHTCKLVKTGCTIGMLPSTYISCQTRLLNVESAPSN